MTDAETMFEERPAEQTPSISGASVDLLDDNELDRAPFGIICLDAEGTILRYNLYESRLARLDRNQVLGRNFFNEVARCTRGDAFEGRFQRFVAGSRAPADRRFEFVFDFAFGAQVVAIELHDAGEHERFYLFVNRKSVGAPRDIVGEIAASQRALAPDEPVLGVQRDELERRFVDAPVAMFAALRTTFAKLAPQSSTLFAHEWGVQWGRRAAIDLEADSLERDQRSLDEQAMGSAARALGDYIERRGWGRVNFDFSPVREGLVAVSLERSVLAESSPRATFGRSSTKDGACALIAGFLAGALSHMAGRKLIGREVCCVVHGAPQCEIVLIGADRAPAIDRALANTARTVGALRAALRKPAPRTP
ncbi:MAG: hypothetical protein JNK05_41665 [Myxococcales bacterium]|nr:hypothetical protein [Myxococcales bacterium]